MTGGLLQIVAKSVEDIFLTGNPEITLFKMVYKRHSNFSKEDKYIKFNTPVRFGKKASCIIKNLGDLLSNLHLVLELPEINLYYKKITKGEVVTMLNAQDITWITTNLQSNLSNDDITNIQTLIDAKILSLTTDRNIIDNPDDSNDIIGKLATHINDINYSDISGTMYVTHDLFYQTILNSVISFDDNNIIYHFLKAAKLDSSNRTLTNMTQLNEKLYLIYRDLVVNKTGNESTFNDENLIMMNMIERDNFSINNNLLGIDSKTLFMNRIQKLFSDDITYEPSSGSYTTIDAYNIYKNYFDVNSVNINNEFNVDVIKQNVLDYIFYILGKNLQLLIKIYHNIGLAFRFMFYKRFVYDSSTSAYSTEELFLNVSSTNSQKFNDQFSNNFKLEPVLGEPENLNHFFYTRIEEQIQPFHIANRDYFRYTTYDDYFDDLSLWTRLDFSSDTYDSSNEKITTALSITESSSLTKLDKIYLMNFIPFKIIRDIYTAVKTFVVDIMANSGVGGLGYTNMTASLNSIMGSEGTTVITALETAIPITSLIDSSEEDVSSDVSKLNDLSSTYKKSVNDVLVTALFVSDSFITYNSNKYNIMEYIKTYYNDKITETIIHYNSNNPSNQVEIDGSDHTSLKDTVGIFFMSKTDLPEHSKYVANNYSLFQINNADVQFNNPLGSSTGKAVVMDAVSSIWYNIYTELISSYNSFYNETALNNTYIAEKLGDEMQIHKIHIDSNEAMMSTLKSDESDSYTIDYYQASSSQITSIKNYLNTALTSYNDLMTRYNANKNILNITNLLLPIATHNYETFNNTHDYITNIIEADQVTYKYDNSVINLSTIKSNIQSDTIGIMDIINNIITESSTFYDIGISGNPYVNGTNLYTAYETYISPLNTSERTTHKNTFDTVFSWLNSTELYKDVKNIALNYNNFTTENDVYDYLIDYIAKNSNINEISTLQSTQNDISNYDSLTDIQKLTALKQQTYDNVTNYYNIKVSNINDSLLVLNGDDSTDSLMQTITNMNKHNTRANFAWIKNLGHYIIKNISVDIGGEIIERQTGEFMQIWHELTHLKGKEIGYNKMIGNIEELYTYDNISKPKKTLYIPLKLWFTKNLQHALPLIALHHTDIKINFEFATLNECAYWEDNTIFRLPPKTDEHISPITIPKINGKLMGEFIYVEKDERKLIASKKHEYLVETIDYTNDTFVDSSQLIDDKIHISSQFNNSVKELFWVVQKQSYINGTRTNKEIVNYYGVDTDGNGNPIKKIKIKFSGKEREQYKDGQYYNYIVPYKHHTNIPSDGIYSYSFSLYPELKQPSGSCNMSKIEEVFFITELDDTLLSDIKNNSEKVKFTIYSCSYNILRIMSGMAGLAFY